MTVETKIQQTDKYNFLDNIEKEIELYEHSLKNKVGCFASLSFKAQNSKLKSGKTFIDKVCDQKTPPNICILSENGGGKSTYLSLTCPYKRTIYINTEQMDACKIAQGMSNLGLIKYIGYEELEKFYKGVVFYTNDRRKHILTKNDKGEIINRNPWITGKILDLKSFLDDLEDTIKTYEATNDHHNDKQPNSTDKNFQCKMIIFDSFASLITLFVQSLIDCEKLKPMYQVIERENSVTKKVEIVIEMTPDYAMKQNGVVKTITNEFSAWMKRMNRRGISIVFSMPVTFDENNKFKSKSKSKLKKNEEIEKHNLKMQTENQAKEFLHAQCSVYYLRDKGRADGNITILKDRIGINKDKMNFDNFFKNRELVASERINQGTQELEDETLEINEKQLENGFVNYGLTGLLMRNLQ